MPDLHAFGFFPWGAYLAFGMSAGSVIRTIPPEATERAMQWAALLGGGLILACQYFANLPYTVYAKSDFWLNSPAQVLTKVGVILLMLALAFLWTRYGAKDGWSWVRQFGTTSLLVYWVHIELVYGRWLWFLKGQPDGGSDRTCGGDCDPADAGDLDCPDLPPSHCGRVGGHGLDIRAEARPRGRGLRDWKERRQECRRSRPRGLLDIGLAAYSTSAWRPTPLDCGGILRLSPS